MENDNCLWKMKCPKCGSLGPYMIATVVWQEWTDEGTHEGYDYEFQEGAHIECKKCEHRGRVRDFRTEPVV